MNATFSSLEGSTLCWGPFRKERVGVGGRLERIRKSISRIQIRGVQIEKKLAKKNPFRGSLHPKDSNSVVYGTGKTRH